MSLVILTNQDQDKTFRQEQSIYSPWSFVNSLSSVYNIPANSQVCLQSAKVNLDGRVTITKNNSIWYDWFGDLLLQNVDSDIDNSTSYPIAQNFGEFDKVLELTTDELADTIQDNHKEYHPNRKTRFSCEPKRNSGLDFLGLDFGYGFFNAQNASTKPSSFSYWLGTVPAGARFNYTPATGVFQREDVAGTQIYPAVGIGLGTPLSLSNGSMRVDFTNANASGVQWAIGLSRDIPVLTEGQRHRPPYYDPANNKLSDRTLLSHQFYTDFCAHRNASGELVITHSVRKNDSETERKEVEYWLNTNSDLTGAGRYDIDTNTEGYDWIQFKAMGEEIEIYIGSGAGTDLVTGFYTNQPKTSYCKPISQTCWCLHPVLFVGRTTTNKTNSLTLNTFSGMNLATYNSRNPATPHAGGWYEAMSMLSNDGNNQRGVALCREVDVRRVPNDPTFATIYSQVALNASNVVDYTPAMILTPNSTYSPTPDASCAELFGFPGRSLVNTGVDSKIGSAIFTTFSSDGRPLLTSVQSIFVRLNGFGQQVLNAKTGNKSSILAHLPTADSRAVTGSSGRFFYEPTRDVWLDLNNAYDIKSTDFSIDMVYSNEQYAKILQGQTIVVLYFRKKV
jgi:hypothetical protein